MSFAGSDRFELRTRLGKGAFGVVYRARDVHRSADVALKTLHRVAPDALLRFKTEFRALQDLQHPNVVHFHELFEEEGEWFFTMELVEGVELLDWVCPERPLDPSAETLAARFDEARLRDALKQLAGALAALHEAGLVHRDLKPSNVRVTPEGRVVLLDFGLVVDTAGEADAAIVGTPAYMAPEQAHSKQVGPAADLYGLGVLLFEALTGTLPFAGAPLRIITLKQREEPPPPRVLAADVPFDLDALCEELLRREPERRPSAKQVRRRLGRGSSTPPPSTPAPDPHFVGRELELDVLRAAYRESRQEGFRSVVVEGDSGVGKSALVQAFASSLADDDAVVLRGRCYEHETVPYKAFDGIVDALAKYLERLPDEQCEAVLPRRAALLEHVFPVLGQVRAIALAPRTRRPPREGLQLRELAFEALIELFARLADRVPLVLTVDDLQWADDESLLFLEALREPPDAPALLFVATARPLEDECPPNVRACVERCADRRIALGGLGGREARDLAEQILQLGGSALDADELAAQAGGHPLFIAELARHVQRAALRGGPLRIDLDAALRERVEQLAPEARRCLFASCVAARPLDRELLRDACGLDESFDRIVKALRVGRFVRTARRGETATVEPFHDRVRAAAMAALGPGERELQHRRIGLALEKHRHRDVEALALHFREAGDRVRAARYALAAGDRAAEALAFHRAAEHYADALRFEPSRAPADERALRVKLADALRQAGRGADAAREYERASRGAAPDEARRLRVLAAQTYLQSGRMAPGMDLTEAILDEVGLGMPRSRPAALASMLYHRARLAVGGVEMKRPARSSRVRDQLAIAQAISATMAMVDFIRGADFQVRALRLAQVGGDRERYVRALATEGATSGCTDAPPMKKGARLLQRAETQARELGDPYLEAYVALSWAAAQLAHYRFPEAFANAERADAVFRESCQGVPWELSTTHHILSMCLWNQGRYGELAERAPRWLREARERSDLYGSTTITVSGGWARALAGDRPDAGMRAIDEAMGEWGQPPFQLQHYMAMQAKTELEIYAGRGGAAYARQERDGPAFKRSLLTTMPTMRFVVHTLRARSAIAFARESRARRRALVDEALRELAKARKAMPQAANQGVADAYEAGARELQGDPSAAARLLRQAIPSLEAAHMGGFAAGAKLHLGTLLGGDEGAALREAATSWLGSHGVGRPEAYARLRAPGGW